ncbi:MAG: phosphoribosylaminoimidazolesuccinocarboxamide synthase [Candidatus Saganbacteria bacterium]|nr:phosphoribosylaminoimidazolesuccinocarboxamide synthase [Candidatus Saganbacteria bacterium]
MSEPLLKIELPGLKLFKRGKVRDVFDLGDRLLLVASDRISAFDVVMPNGIPDKGRILTQISLFWFEFTKDIVSNHLITSNMDEYPAEFQKYRNILDGRSMIGKKTNVIPIECVVRGYLSGSGWKEYQEAGSVCGIKLPEGLKESEKLPEPIFTPSTKADTGHDLNITGKEAIDRVGEKTASFVKEKSIAVYKAASDYAAKRGIIIADTKFEFGFINDKIILIDEILTPDSSRFWPADKYKAGESQPSYDKQFLRDYLVSIKWGKQPPAPQLPKEVIEKTREKYLEAFRLLAGKKSFRRI